MRKKLINFLKKFQNELSDDATDLAVAVKALIAEAENAEEEVTFDDLKEALKGLLNKEEVEEIVNGLHDKFKLELRNDFSGNGKSKGQNYLDSEKSTKDFLNSIVEAHSKGTKVSEVWQKKLIENDVTGLVYPSSIATEIKTKWRDGTGLFSAIEKVHDSHFKIPYSAQDQNVVNVRARGHKKGKKKTPLNIVLNAKQINLSAVYADIDVHNVDIARLSSNSTTFLNWVVKKSYQQLIYEVERAIIIGDGRTAAADNKVRDIEAIGTKTVSDAWTIVDTATGNDLRKDVRTLTDQLLASNGAERWGYARQETITELCEFVYGDGGTVDFRDPDVVAKGLGLNRLIPYEMPEGVEMVVITPEEYYRIGGEPFGLQWDAYIENKRNFRSEIFMGGAIAGLFSTGVLLAAEVEEESPVA